MTPHWHNGAGNGVCGSALDLPGYLLSETPFYAVSQLVPDAHIHPCSVLPPAVPLSLPSPSGWQIGKQTQATVTFGCPKLSEVPLFHLKFSALSEQAGWCGETLVSSSLCSNPSLPTASECLLSFNCCYGLNVLSGHLC